MIKILAFFEHFLSRPHRIAPEYIAPLQNVLRGQYKFPVEMLIILNVITDANMERRFPNRHQPALR